MRKRKLNMRKSRHAIPSSQTLAGLVLSAALLAGCSGEDEIVPELAAKPEIVETPVAKEKTSREKAVKKLGVPAAYEGKLTSLAELNIRDAKLQNIISGLKYPWAFEFISPDEILLTEIAGNLIHFNLTTRTKTLIKGVPEVGSGFSQIGLLDVEIHPDFKNNHRIYLSYAKPDPETHKYHSTEVATAILEANELREVKPIVNKKNYGWAPSNFGGALEFDDEGYLYISIGDQGEDVLTHRSDRLEGKILRLNADGSTPADNPFSHDEKSDPRIYALGVRNAQGLHFDEKTGILFETEHGPLGGDEINIIEAGLDYGWPTISYGNNYSSLKPMGLGTHKEGLEQPLFYYLPSIAISPITVYRGEMFKEWEGDLLVGALKGEHVSKLDYNDGAIRSSRSILNEVGGRIRDLKVAADGSIYILSQTTGLFRLHRDPPPTPGATAANGGKKTGAPAAAPAAVPPAVHPGKKYYDLVCSGCHDSGASGAPVLGNFAQWKPIMEQPLETTRDHVMNGFNNMPERGLCYVCSETGLMEMVDYMFTMARGEREE